MVSNELVSMVMELFAHKKLNTVLRPLIPCFETIFIAFYNAVHLQLTFFIQSLQIFDAFYKSSVFLNYLTLLYVGYQLKQLLAYCFVYYSHQYCLCVATKTFRVLRGASELLYFLVIPLSAPTCRRPVQAKHTKSQIFKPIVKH